MNLATIEATLLNSLLQRITVAVKRGEIDDIEKAIDEFKSHLKAVRAFYAKQLADETDERVPLALQA